MIILTGLDHIVLRTNRLEEMLNFYCKILGCHIERAQPQYALTQLRAGDNLIDLIEVDELSAVNNTNLHHFCLRVQNFNIEKLKKYLAGNNVEMLRPGKRYSSLGLGESFYINDPQGNEVELVDGSPLTSTTPRK